MDTESRHRRKIIGSTVSVAIGTILLTASLLPEMYVGRSIPLRILIAAMVASTVSGIALGLALIIRSLPFVLGSILFGSAAVITFFIANSISAFAIMPLSSNWLLTLGASFILSLVILCIFAGLGALAGSRNKIVIFAAVIFMILLLGYGISLLLPDYGRQKANVEDLVTPKDKVTLKAPFPASPGAYTVKTLFYGNGKDKHRPEYGAQTNIITKPVNASPFLPEGWSVARTAYWGFDQTRLPINGRVWVPEGKGPFPLVLIVHGAYKMTARSDTGFAYLGELLASRGYIVASIDENFLNYGWHRYGDFEDSDIDARGWLVLQHLRTWQKWNDIETNVFFKKVDMHDIALIGHSRGGEAITAAASFNRMGRYPRNGSIALGFNFNIRTLIVFAPSDIYQSPYERTTPVSMKDINYLLLLGTQDRQVPSILGSRVYQRIKFADNDVSSSKQSKEKKNSYGNFIKAALYIHRANHSQFNTSWGIYDFPWPYRFFSNIAEQLSGYDQRRVTEIYVSSFLDATLKGDKRYVPIFRDYRVIKGWLPRTAYISRFEDSSFHLISNFDEDIDPQTTTVSGGKIIGRNLSHWHEQDIDYHYYQPYGSRSNRLVSVSWEAQTGTQPVLEFDLPASQVTSWNIKPEDNLVFSIATPDSQASFDITVSLTDTAGRSSQLPLSKFYDIHAPLLSKLTRMTLFEKPTPVQILQTLSIPFTRFLEMNSAIKLNKLSRVSFIFDKNHSGTLLLDDIGIDQSVPEL
ncbi:MAG: hypothetical protein WA610_01850 [Thermodesulfovibrionales bacterium]